MVQKRRVLISVSDKRRIVEFASGLARRDFQIVSTGGTAKTLRDAGLLVTDVSEVTGFPEMMGGRLKTLHPKIHGGLLGRLEDAEIMAKHEIEFFDLLVVNLYPFETTIAQPGCTLDHAVENIDIGGPAMLRAGAKNWNRLGVVVDPDDYYPVIDQLDDNGGTLTDSFRFELAAKVFAHTAGYDAVIARYLQGKARQGLAA